MLMQSVFDNDKKSEDLFLHGMAEYILKCYDEDFYSLQLAKVSSTNLLLMISFCSVSSQGNMALIK